MDDVEALNKRLELILEGEAPYDNFVRWKPLEKQPIGWDPDLNDGVRLNIRPFLTVPDVGEKGAGVLPDKPSINTNKDRGKDVESAPWSHLFNGDRINHHHTTLEEKKGPGIHEITNILHTNILIVSVRKRCYPEAVDGTPETRFRALPQ